jgi:hypothetical protein
MPPKVHWIDTPSPGRLAIMPRPRAGDWIADEVGGWKTAGIDLVVSLLEPHEVVELGLHGEASLCDQHAICRTTDVGARIRRLAAIRQFTRARSTARSARQIHSTLTG